LVGSFVATRLEVFTVEDGRLKKEEFYEEVKENQRFVRRRGCIFGCFFKFAV
jgi:hypothetical protein